MITLDPKELKAVIAVIKGRFTNLTAEDASGLAINIIQAIQEAHDE